MDFFFFFISVAPHYFVYNGIWNLSNIYMLVVAGSAEKLSYRIDLITVVSWSVNISNSTKPKLNTINKAG